jgi:hypothetical protein
MSTINADNLTVQNLTVSGTLAYTDVTAQVGLPAAPSAGTQMERFYVPCRGQSVTVPSGTYAIENVTDKLTVSGDDITAQDVTGSSISYVPPAGTKTIIYEFDMLTSREGDGNPILSLALFVDGTEVLYARTNEQYSGMVKFRWMFEVGGSGDTDYGIYDTWTTAKTIKLGCARHGGDNEVELHETYYWENSATAHFHAPRIGITALA